MRRIPCILAAILAVVLLLCVLPAASAEAAPGDLNRDGKVNGKDITLLQRAVAGGYGVTLDEHAADLNGDGKVNAKDVALLQRFFAGGYGAALTPLPPVLSQEQQALIAYAEAMLARGARVQYADTRLVPADSVKLYRWQNETLSAEAYTSQYTGYTNCSNFAHDVYYFGLGYNIGYDATVQRLPGGADAIAYSANDKSIAADERSLILFYKVTGTETEAQKTALLAQFSAALQPADLIVYRYSNKNSGHVMFYVGDGRIIHSTGSVYNYDTRVEKREANGSVQEMDLNALFEPGNYRYLFENKSQFGIVRPLAIWDGTVPQEAMDRLANLQGVMVEKLCSKTVGQTVEPGEELSYTFHMENRSGKSAELEVRDVLSDYTEFVSGCDAVDGNSLAWTVTVPAGQSVDLSYTVRVKADAPIKKMLLADKATVGGVKCKCPTVRVGKHLSDAQKAALSQAARSASSDDRGWALASELYRDALGMDLTGVSPMQTIFAGLFKKSTTAGHFYLTDDTPYFPAVAPTIYGGRVVKMGTLYSKVRTRGPYLDQVEIGDIAVCTDSTADSPADSDYVMMMIAGEDAVLLLTGDTPALLTGDEAQAALDTLISYKKFAVLRPAALPDVT